MDSKLNEITYDFRQFEDPAPGDGDKGGGDKGGGEPPKPDPVDPGKIAEQARLDVLKSLGFSTEAELKAALAAGKGKPKEPNDEDTKKLIEAQTAKLAEYEAREKSHRIGDEVSRALDGLKTELQSKGDFADVLKRALAVEDDSVIVQDEGGHKRYNSQGKPLSVAEYAEEVLKAKPYFVKTGVNAGPGVDPRGGDHGGGTETNEEKVKKLAKQGVVHLSEIEDAGISLGKKPQKEEKK